MTVEAPPPPAPPPELRTSGLAIASLVLSLVLCCIPASGIAAVICGHLALGPISRGEAGGKGLAIAGLVLGYIGTALGILGLVLWAAGVCKPPWMQE